LLMLVLIFLGWYNASLEGNSPIVKQGTVPFLYVIPAKAGI